MNPFFDLMIIHSIALCAGVCNPPRRIPIIPPIAAKSAIFSFGEFSSQKLGIRQLSFLFFSVIILYMYIYVPPKMGTGHFKGI